MRVIANELKDDLEILKSIPTNKSIGHSDMLYFSGTNISMFNGEIFITKPLSTEFSGAVALLLFSAIIDKYGTNEVDIIRQENDSITVKFKRSISKLATDDSYQTPQIDEINNNQWQQIPNDFIQILEHIVPVTSMNICELKKACIHVKNNIVEASNGFKLAIYNIEGDMQEMFIRRDMIKTISKMQPSHYYLSKDWIHFKNTKDIILSIRRIDIANYPNLTELYNTFKGIIPITMPDKLISSLERANIFLLHEFEYNKHVTIIISDNKLKIETKSKDGSYSNIITIDSKENAIFIIEPQSLIDMLLSSNQFEIGDRAISVNTEKLKYMTCLLKNNQSEKE